MENIEKIKIYNLKKLVEEKHHVKNLIDVGEIGIIAGEKGIMAFNRKGEGYLLNNLESSLPVTVNGMHLEQPIPIRKEVFIPIQEIIDSAPHREDYLENFQTLLERVDPDKFSSFLQAIDEEIGIDHNRFYPKDLSGLELEKFYKTF